VYRTFYPLYPIYISDRPQVLLYHQQGKPTVVTPSNLGYRDLCLSSLQQVYRFNSILMHSSIIGIDSVPLKALSEEALIQQARIMADGFRTKHERVTLRS
jgi:hypothetical protein